MIACDRCSTACLQEKDVAEMVRCIELGRTCATVCGFAARLMWNRSEFASKACTLCVEICLACVEECSKHELGHCRVCAESCQHCADACSRMIVMEQYDVVDLTEVI